MRETHRDPTESGLCRSLRLSVCASLSFSFFPTSTHLIIPSQLFSSLTSWEPPLSVIYSLSLYASSVVFLTYNFVSHLCSVCAGRPALQWGIRVRPAARSRPGDEHGSTPGEGGETGCEAIGGLSRTKERRLVWRKETLTVHAFF